MAVLSDPNRIEVLAQLMRENTASISLNKTELRAAVNAVDDWADAKAVEYNQALPAAAQSGLTNKQKAFLLAVVILKRHNIIP